MADSVRIQMMGSFLIYIDEKRIENLVGKSRKGSALMEYLVLHRGKSVPNQQILEALWAEKAVSNPENALKTLVSRLRTLLNQISPNLGACIASDRGAYHWENLPGMRVDVLELMDTFDALKSERDPDAQRVLYGKVLELYRGELFQTGELSREAGYAQQLHSHFLSGVYGYVDLLRKEEAYKEISVVCRTALEVDRFDDRLHIELMKALVGMNRTNDALVQYKHAENLNYRYLGAAPSDEMKAFYHQMNRNRMSLEFNLESIRRELYESSREHGAFVCEYGMFKEIYNLQMRNLERLDTTMFLGIIMVGDADNDGVDFIRQGSVMEGLIEILRDNLRKGDIITHFSPSVIAVLLPTVNYETGSMVMERIRKLFYERFPGSSLPFSFRLGKLGGDTLRQDAQRAQAGQGKP